MLLPHPVNMYINMKVSQNTRCFFGLHKYEVYKEENILDARKEICSKAIISRCSNCGKIKVKYVPLTKNY